MGGRRGRRSGEAQAALGRKAGPMKHRLEPRGGSKVEEWEHEYLGQPEDEVCCAMRQPTDSEGNDLGTGLLDSCPRPATHQSRNGLLPMCDWHSEYYRRWIGPVERRPE